MLFLVPHEQQQQSKIIKFGEMMTESECLFCLKQSKDNTHIKSFFRGNSILQDHLRTINFLQDLSFEMFLECFYEIQETF